MSRQYSGLVAFAVALALAAFGFAVYILFILPLAIVGWLAMKLTSRMRRSS